MILIAICCSFCYRFSLIAIICGLFRLADSADPNDPCHKVQSNTNRGVQAIGEMNGKILLITSDWYVFEVPRNALRPDLGKFYLNSGGKPMKTSEKWPELWKDSQFTKIRTESKLAVSYVDSSHGQHDIRFETMLTTTNTKGVNFDVETRSVETGAVISYNPNQFTCIGVGSGDTEWSYCFSKRPDGVIEITAWKWLGEKNEWWHRIYGGFPLCMSPNSPDQIYTHQKNNSDCGSDRNVDWPVAYHGFLSSADDESDGKAKFYLFAESYVLIIDETVFDMDCAKSGETCDSPSTSYRKINYDDFIQCDGQVASASVRALTAAKGIDWAIWLAVILALLLILLCCLLLLAREAMAGGKRKSSKNGTPKKGFLAGGPGGGGSSFTPQSVREALSSRFGMLTAAPRTPSGPHAPSNSVHSPKTARSNLAHSINKLSRKPSGGVGSGGNSRKSRNGPKAVTARSSNSRAPSGRLSNRKPTKSLKEPQNPNSPVKSKGKNRHTVTARSSRRVDKFGRLSKNQKSSKASRRDLDATGRSRLG